MPQDFPDWSRPQPAISEKVLDATISVGPVSINHSPVVFVGDYSSIYVTVKPVGHSWQHGIRVAWSDSPTFSLILSDSTAFVNPQFQEYAEFLSNRGPYVRVSIYNDNSAQTFQYRILIYKVALTTLPGIYVPSGTKASVGATVPSGGSDVKTTFAPARGLGWIYVKAKGASYNINVNVFTWDGALQQILTIDESIGKWTFVLPFMYNYTVIYVSVINASPFDMPYFISFLYPIR
jgi:hypothetical protein